MCRRQNFCKDALSLPSLFRSWVGSEMFRIYFKNAKGVPRKQANTVLRYMKVKKRSSYAAKRMKALTTSWFFAPKYASVINVILLAVRFLLDAVCLAKLPGLFHLPVEHGGTWWNMVESKTACWTATSVWIFHFFHFYLCHPFLALWFAMACSSAQRNGKGIDRSKNVRRFQPAASERIWKNQNPQQPQLK